MKNILNIAAGKFAPINLPDKNFKIVNLDTMYYHHDSPENIEKSMYINNDADSIYNCKRDAFEFMERTSLVFDEVVCYRFLEHVSFDRIPYFIYLISTVLKVGGTFDCIVPNYLLLAEMIFKESEMNIGGTDWDSHNTLLTTELLNEPGCPHASIWTSSRVKYYMEFEGRFEIDIIDPSYQFDGRDIYIRFIAKRINKN